MAVSRMEILVNLDLATVQRANCMTTRSDRALHQTQFYTCSSNIDCLPVGTGFIHIIIRGILTPLNIEEGIAEVLWKEYQC